MVTVNAALNLRIGTCAWTDKSLIEAGWYPRGTNTAEGRLRYYATQFPIVEVDSSYYALPSATNSRLWVERTPADFVFDIKAFRIFTTHQTPPTALPRDILAALPAGTGSAARKNLYYKDMPTELIEELWQRFIGAIQPLRQASKLGVVLFQFPPWFAPGGGAFDHIEECRARMSGFDLAIEFRHHGWLNEANRERTVGFLRARNLSFVAVDEPQGFSSSVPPLIEVTGPYVIVRFHGRNADTWESSGPAASDRFNYVYRREELVAWGQRIAEVARQPIFVHALMNTNYGTQGPENAKLLADILGAGLWPRPEPGVPGTGTHPGALGADAPGADARTADASAASQTDVPKYPNELPF